MTLQVYLLFYLIAWVSSASIEKKEEPATSFSIIHRYDIPEVKIEAQPATETATDISKVEEKTEKASDEKKDNVTEKPMPATNANSPITNKLTPVVYEVIKPVYEIVQEDTKDNAAGISQGVPVPTPITRPYPSLLIVPMAKPGPLITPGLSSYGSPVEIVEIEANKAETTMSPPELKSTPLAEEKSMEPASEDPATSAESEDSDKSFQTHVTFFGPESSYSW